MNRRGFLRFLGAGAVSAPAAAKSIASTVAMDSLPFGTAIGSAYNRHLGPLPSSVTRDTSWAVNKLAKMALPELREREWNRTEVRALDVDLSELRSMSLSTKVAIQRKRNFERNRREESSYLEGVIAGLWS